MSNIVEYIRSGILECYVLGSTTPEETIQVEAMAAAYEEIRKEIDEISRMVERYADEHALQPSETVKTFLMATIDYTERLTNGEKVTAPPVLHEGSKPSDYSTWLYREDMTLPPDFDSLYAKIIGYTPDVITAIVWIKEMAPQEIHHDEFEKFMIIEGSCTITIEENVHELHAGDYLSIPLYKNHFVKVTSSIPCKVILQRIAA